jgi:hypothetical protein
VFGARGVAPIGYAAFAFVLGVTVGMLVRRTLPAMALTLVVFVALQFAMPLLVRPRLMPPVTSTFELSQANMAGLQVQEQGGGPVRVHLRSAVPGHPGAWVLSSNLVDPSGSTIASSGEGAPRPRLRDVGTLRTAGAGLDGCWVELNRLGYQQHATYHPLDRFWPFQWIETGIYAVLTVGLTWFSFWWIRRRLS